MSKHKTDDVCKEEIVRQIEKHMSKGLTEGMMFHPCANCEDYTVLTISVPMTNISNFSSGVRWKAYGHGMAGKMRK
jgi:hypothetical protein